MALVDLISRLEQDAEARVQAIHREADEAVRALEAQAHRAATEESARRVGQRQAALEATLQRERSEARQRTRAEVLSARRALFERVLARAAALTPEVAASPAYLAVLPAHAEEALAYLEGLRPVLRCTPETAAHLAPLVHARADVTLAPADGLPPGVVAEAADGSVRVDNTLPARLRRLEARLIVELLGTPEGGAT